MKNRFLNLTICASLIISSSFLGTLKLQAQSTQSTNGIPISGKWYGWSSMTLKYNNGSFSGTYSDTWDDDPGTFKFTKKNGKWTGTYGEKSINRRGVFNNVIISADGKKISGKYSTTSVGEKGGEKKNYSFSWKLVKRDSTIQEEPKKDSCEYPDMSGIWVCKDKGYLKLSQTNEAVDGDCVSFVEGKFVRAKCSGDLWATAQGAISYVRGKIVNGKYDLEILSQSSKKSLGYSTKRTTLSGIIQVDAESLSPQMKYGWNDVNLKRPMVTDPHSGKKVMQMQWMSPPPLSLKNNCVFKKSNDIPKAADPSRCEDCKKQELLQGMSFANNRITWSQGKRYVEGKNASSSIYQVGSGVAIASGTGRLWYTSDILNDYVNLVPRYNLRITSVRRDGMYIDVHYEVCDWKTGKKIKGKQTRGMVSLTKEQLKLPDSSSIIQEEYRKSGSFLYRWKLTKLLSQ